MRNIKMILCTLLIAATVGSSQMQNLNTINHYDQEIKFKPNQEAKIHIFVSSKKSKRISLILR